MAVEDRIKEEIGWLKVAFVIFSAIDISLIGWLAQNFQSASSKYSSSYVYNYLHSKKQHIPGLNGMLRRYAAPHPLRQDRSHK